MKDSNGLNNKITYWFIPTLLVLLVIGIFKPLMVYEDLVLGKAVMIEGLLSNGHTFDDGVYELTGTVQTFESQFIEPKSPLADYKVTALPYSWKETEGIRYASHRMIIKGLKVNQLYGLYMMDAMTAYSVYADGVLIGSQGYVSKDPGLSRPESKAQTLLFQPTSSEIELVIHLSNHESNLMGIWQKTLFGTAEHILEYEHKANLSDAVIIGAILFLAIYMWILHIVLKRDPSTYYFAMACTFVAIKSLFSGQQIGFEILPMIEYDLGLRIAYLMVPAILVVFIAFARECFKNEIPLPYLKLSIILSTVQSAVILLVPQKTYMSTFIGYQLFILFSCLMILYWVIRAVRNKREGAWIYLLGYSIFFIFAMNDILYSMLLIKTGFYLGFGLFALIMSQATLIAIYYARALKTEAYLKQNLENIVVQRTKELEAERNKFENLSKVDSLTLIYNRGYLDEVLGYEFEGYKRYNGSCSILLMDLDHFKKVNDTYGHVFGDTVLKRVSEVLVQNSRRSDVVGRYGGEEFLVIMRFTTLSDAIVHAEHLRTLIENERFSVANTAIFVTASFGIAEISMDMADDKALLEAADQALYRAKSSGRNRVAFHEVE